MDLIVYPTPLFSNLQSWATGTETLCYMSREPVDFQDGVNMLTLLNPAQFHVFLSSEDHVTYSDCGNDRHQRTVFCFNRFPIPRSLLRWYRFRLDYHDNARQRMGKNRPPDRTAVAGQ